MNVFLDKIEDSQDWKRLIEGLLKQYGGSLNDHSLGELQQSILGDPSFVDFAKTISADIIETLAKNSETSIPQSKKFGINLNDKLDKETKKECRATFEFANGLLNSVDADFQASTIARSLIGQSIPDVMRHVCWSICTKDCAILEEYRTLLEENPRSVTSPLHDSISAQCRRSFGKLSSEVAINNRHVDTMADCLSFFFTKFAMTDLLKKTVMHCVSPLFLGVLQFGLNDEAKDRLIGLLFKMTAEISKIQNEPEQFERDVFLEIRKHDDKFGKFLAMLSLKEASVSVGLSAIAIEAFTSLPQALMLTLWDHIFMCGCQKQAFIVSVAALALSRRSDLMQIGDARGVRSVLAMSNSAVTQAFLLRIKRLFKNEMFLLANCSASPPLFTNSETQTTLSGSSGAEEMINISEDNSQNYKNETFESNNELELPRISFQLPKSKNEDNGSANLAPFRRQSHAVTSQKGILSRDDHNPNNRSSSTDPSMSSMAEYRTGKSEEEFKKQEEQFKAEFAANNNNQFQSKDASIEIEDEIEKSESNESKDGGVEKESDEPPVNVFPMLMDQTLGALRKILVEEQSSAQQI
eukprot:TRINITY_DN37058_c0_g1_i1.p1 TRINITY_DN37058_c0_g1~~TRINITY_DN37058_c0_g1_i1.p1  ORF type:complete len:581 (+),score=127.06 TRINITY_DN37058_c0_g1_i1:106-1848(+)